MALARLRKGTALGKYRLQERIGEGGFSLVYRARDTVEGIDVALKIPHEHLSQGEGLDFLLKEVRLTAKLSHPNVLPIKNADLVAGRLVIAYPLGEGSLAERLKYRLGAKTAKLYAEQLLEAVAYAHRKRIIHCDITPNNVIMRDSETIALSDFGIARSSARTRIMEASGTGTVGYIAPEQAMGQPSFRSDVFSTGLLLYRLFSGSLPRWPYKRPFVGVEKLRRRVRRPFVEFLYKATELEDRKRFRDANQMLLAYRKLGDGVLRE